MTPTRTDGFRAGGCLLYRYSGQRETEGAFLVCSAWLIEALVRTRRTEDIDPSTGALLGNMPQALTHLGVIGAATALSA